MPASARARAKDDAAKADTKPESKPDGEGRCKARRHGRDKAETKPRNRAKESAAESAETKPPETKEAKPEADKKPEAKPEDTKRGQKGSPGDNAPGSACLRSVETSRRSQARRKARQGVRRTDRQDRSVDQGRSRGDAMRCGKTLPTSMSRKSKRISKQGTTPARCLEQTDRATVQRTQIRSAARRQPHRNHAGKCKIRSGVMIPGFSKDEAKELIAVMDAGRCLAPSS